MDDGPLPTPTTEAGRTGLSALLADPGRALVGLDFDGTLAPIVADPRAARGHPGVPAVLARLAAAGMRVAVITGRPAATAVEYGGLAEVPALVVLGHYGLQRWEAGQTTEPDVGAGVEQARSRLPEVLAAAGAPEGTFVEDKGAAVAVHTRRTVDPTAAFDSLRPVLAALAEETGLVVEPGRLVLELRPPGADKGVAVRTLAIEQRPSAIVFVGDDLGDVSAFDAVDGLRAGGVPGLLVCSGSTETSVLAARADLVVDGPAGVVALLSSIAGWTEEESAAKAAANYVDGLRTVEQCLDALSGNPDPEIRWRVVDRLIALSSHRPTTLLALLTALRDDASWKVRDAVAVALVDFPSDESLAGLRRAMLDESLEVRDSAAYAHEQIELDLEANDQV